MPDASPNLSRADELVAVGTRLHTEQGHLDLAKMHYLAALKHDPYHYQALQNLSAVLVSTDKFEAGISVARRAVKIKPSEWGGWGNMGVGLTALCRYDEALEIFDRIIPKIPRNQVAPSLHNFALCYHMLNQHSEALKLYNRSLALNQEQIPVQSDRALCQLGLGSIEEGIRNYDVRWKLLTKSYIWNLGISIWQGEDLKTKSILVHHEQGLGDTIMLCRFIKPLIDMGAEVFVAVPGSLVRLVQMAVPEAKVYDWDQDREKNESREFDYHIPMLSLLGLLKYKVETIDSSPYLITTTWDGKLQLPKEFKIGVCWKSGNHGSHLERRRRKISLTSFLPLTEIDGVKLVSLQKIMPPVEGQKIASEDDIVTFGMEGIVFDCMNRMEDLAATGALIKQLDLVISVDSSVAHLAGGLGVPTIMLSPFARCWRWWNANDEGGWNGEPWYQKMKIIPQSKDGSWTVAIEQATDCVETLMKGNRNG